MLCCVSQKGDDLCRNLSAAVGKQDSISADIDLPRLYIQLLPNSTASYAI